MYEKIKNRISIRELYTEQLVMAGELTSQEAETIAETFADKLQQVLAEVRRGDAQPKTDAGLRRGVGRALARVFVRTGGDRRGPIRHLEANRRQGGLGARPASTLNPKLGKLVAGRAKTAGIHRTARLGVCRDARVRVALARRAHPCA